MTTLMILASKVSRNDFIKSCVMGRGAVTLSNAKPMALASIFLPRSGACPSYLRRATPLYRRCYRVENQTLYPHLCNHGGVSFPMSAENLKNRAL